MKPAKRKPPTKGNHVLQLRLSRDTMKDVDYMIATVPELDGFSRSKFFRAAIRYALDWLGEEGYERDRRPGSKSARH
jgi:hypothetical protein